MPARGQSGRGLPHRPALGRDPLAQPAQGSRPRGRESRDDSESGLFPADGVRRDETKARCATGGRSRGRLMSGGGAPSGEAASRYRRLDDAQIVATLRTLGDRIEERFPGSGLGRVARELLALSGEAADCVAYLRRPHWPLRVAVGVAIAAMFGVIPFVVYRLRLSTDVVGVVEFVQAVESGINDLVFL